MTKLPHTTAHTQAKTQPGPSPDNPFPMEGFPQVCFIKNTISNPNIQVGDYSYYDDPEDSANFEIGRAHV